MSLTLEMPVLPIRPDERGVMRVGGTRVRLDTVVTAWRHGSSPEQIAENFDTLDLADVYAVIGYYLNHSAEIDDYLEKNRLEGEALRAENERRFPQAGLRDRLLARRAANPSEEG